MWGKGGRERAPLQKGGNGMDTSKLCMYCMQDNGGESVCPHCGKDANAPLLKGHMAPGEILGGRFLVGRAVGQDASGIVYIVYDLRKDRTMRIREYMPRSLAYREDGSNELKPMPGMEEAFAAGLNDTREKAQSADEPEKAMPCFEENGTIYVVLRRRKAAAAAPAPVVTKKAARPKPVRDEDEDEVETPDDEEETDDEAEGEETDDEEEEDDEEEVGWFRSHLGALIAMAVIVCLLGGAVLWIMNRNKTGGDTTTQVAQTGEQQSWTAPTKTPDPNGSTGAAGGSEGEIVPPDQSWQYEQGGNTIENQGGAQTPTATPFATAVPVAETPAPATPAPVDDQATSYDPNATGEAFQLDPPDPTLPPIQIGRATSEDVIRVLQARLIQLGWLNIDEPTGQLGNMTKEAIRQFQLTLRQKYDPKIDADGIAGPATIAWLNSPNAPWNPNKAGYPQLPETLPTPGPTPSATPEPTDTPAPTATPEPTPTPSPSPTPFAASVELINEVQDRLAYLGWLDESQKTGVYDNATTLAVLDFQRYINTLYPDAGLPEDGNADANTVNWLNWDGAPTRPEVLEFSEAPAPTDAPAAEIVYSETIDENSDTQAIVWLQSRLIQLGWLKGEPNGTYDEETRAAVSSLQIFLNKQYSLDLDTSGTANTVTLSYLNSDYNQIDNPNPDEAPELKGGSGVVTAAALEAEHPVTAETEPEEIIKVKNALIDLGWMAPPEEGQTVTGEYDQALIDAVTEFKAWLAAMWDAEKWGPHDGEFDLDGKYVDQTTYDVLFSDDAPSKTVG